MNTFSDPVKVIKQIPIEHNAHIADFGCGSGSYSLALAKKIPTSKIYAIDVQKDMIERLKSEAESQGFPNIHVVWGDIDQDGGSRLRTESMDVVFLVNTFFQAEDKKIMMEEAARVLKTDAKLILVDWSESFGNIGPAEEEVVSAETVKLLAEETGFILESELDAGEHHYGYMFRKL